MEVFNIVIEQLFDKMIGYIYSEDGEYRPDEITITIVENEHVEIGDIVCIKHPSKNTIVFYQIIEVPLKRKARDYEEDLARIGKPLIDETRNYPRARAKQMGYVENIEKLINSNITAEDLVMLIEHVKPLSEVYRPRSEVIDKLLTPNGLPITIGKIYPSWKHEYRFELSRLLRQGLLIVGGVGTGKTTTMLTILYRVIKTLIENGGIPHVLIIDKDGEYGSSKLIDLVGRENYLKIQIDEISNVEYVSKERFAEDLLRALGYMDKRSHAAKLLYDTVIQTDLKQPLLLTPQYVEDNIIPVIKQRSTEYYPEIRGKFNEWKKNYKSQNHRYSILNIVSLVKEKMIVHIDLSTARDYKVVYNTLNNILRCLYDIVVRDEKFGCILVIDEAHLFAPERGGITLTDDERSVGELRETLHLIATTGPRNGITPFIATQRPSLITKTMTTQMGQNIIAHRVEDVDLERISEIMGSIAYMVRVLPRGWAIVKGLAANIREPLIIKIEPDVFPESTGRSTYTKFFS